MKISFRYLLIFVLFPVLSGCELDAWLDNCGNDQIFSNTWFTNIANVAEHLHQGNYDGAQERVFLFYTPPVGDMCTNVHVTVSSETILWVSLAEMPEGLVVETNVQTGVLHDVAVPLTFVQGGDLTVIGGQEDIGLKQLYGDGPGAIERVYTLIKFLSQGTVEEDLELFKSKVSSINISIYYNDYK